jgi:hypothetical protein
MSETGLLDFIKGRKVSPWLKTTARIGFAAKSLLYIIIGYLAFKLVLGIGGKTAGMKDVLLTIHEQTQPFGDIILACVAAGLVAHTLWRFMQSIFNADNYKNTFVNIINRIGFFTSVVFYGALAFYAAKIIFAFGSSSSTQSMIGLVLTKPFGRWLIGFAGFCIGVSGIYQVYFGTFSKFEFKFELNKMNSFEEKLCRYVSIIGLTARGIVFLLMSILLIQAAWDYDPQKAGGMGKALLQALYEPYGHWLLGVASAGLVAYGGYCIILAKYRKIPLN